MKHLTKLHRFNKPTYVQKWVGGLQRVGGWGSTLSIKALVRTSLDWIDVGGWGGIHPPRSSCLISQSTFSVIFYMRCLVPIWLRVQFKDMLKTCFFFWKNSIRGHTSTSCPIFAYPKQVRFTSLWGREKWKTLRDIYRVTRRNIAARSCEVVPINYFIFAEP